MGSPERRQRRAAEARGRPVTNGQAVDLAVKAMSDEQAWQVQETLELHNGLRCNGCGRRVTIGIRGISVDPRDAAMPIVQRVACTREDCDEAERVRDGAACIEVVEFAWVDANGPDAPPARVIMERNERHAAALEAQAAAAPAVPGLPDCGHGHVHARADGATARCGGPAICSLCRRDEEALG